MDTDDLGTLEKAGEQWRLTFTRHFSHPLEKVWRAVTEPEHRKAWFPDVMMGELEAGAPLKFVTATGDGFDGEMLVFDPPAVMELMWGTDLLRIELEPDGDGTRLTLVDTFGELGKAARDGAGWHECLDRLVGSVHGAAPRPWGEPWMELFVAYKARVGPEAATIGPPPGWEPSSHP
jgi:uncharacterized protein YndB with AHSA1/START domain